MADTKVKAWMHKHADGKDWVHQADFFCNLGVPEEVGSDLINHPPHYGGDTTYETIKVIEAWDLNFHVGNAVKYLSRIGKKGDPIEDLEKARWYIDRELENRRAGA